MVSIVGETETYWEEFAPILDVYKNSMVLVFLII